MQLNPPFLKIYKTPLLLVIVCMAFYKGFAYNLARTDLTKLIMLYIALFFLFYKLIKLLKHNITFLTWVAFGFRAVFILAIPNLSQDFYRFIWDGRMILEGINPYLFTVESFISNHEFPVAQAQELYQGMGALNASHFTNYPPINQLCFVMAGLFAGKSILGSAIVMRLLIIAADFGTLYFGKKLLEKLNIPGHHIFWYILNPFIIIELTGNLHFEGVMIFFFIWSLYLLHSKKWQLAAVVLALSVSVKLIPLIFLPLFFQWFTLTPRKNQKKQNIIARRTRRGNLLKWNRWLHLIRNEDNNHEILKQVQDDENNLPGRAQSRSHGNVKKWIPAFISTSLNNHAGMTRLIGFYCIVTITTLLLFLPFYSSEFINNYTQTVALWFQDFEFNASIYYIAREIGYLFTGYNEIVIIGKIIPLLVILFVLFITFFRKNKTTLELITAMLLILSFYFFTATTVHPWYVATLLILSVFTKYKFPLVWSFAAILSYLAYANTNNTENLWIIGLEYVIVYSVFIWEVFIKKATKMAA